MKWWLVILVLLHSMLAAVSAVSTVPGALFKDGGFADRARWVLTEAGLDRVDAGSGAVPLRDQDGNTVGLAAVAVGFEPRDAEGLMIGATVEEKRRASILAARISMRREMLAYLEREIEVRDHLVRRCIETWREVDGEEHSTFVGVEESSSEVVETCRGLVVRSIVIDVVPIEGGVRVIGYAAPGEAPRIGEGMLVADSPEIARALIARDLEAGVIVDPGTVVVADASGRPRSVMAWATRDGEDRIAALRARAEAQRTLLAFLKGDLVESESRFERWSQTVLSADDSLAESARHAIDKWRETRRDLIASRVSGQGRQLGEVIRRNGRTTVFTVAEWIED